VKTIQRLNNEQIVVLRNIGFSSILLLASSTFPKNVFNWIASHMDTNSGYVELPNGLSFTINQECVRLIMDLPIGPQPISFTSTPDVVHRVNMEIHGSGRTPTVYELSSLIINGLSGSTFGKAFILLTNCTLLCPSNQLVPSAIYYYAIDDFQRITNFNWCSYVLHWLLLSVKKYQLDGCNGDCAGCGLIPVVRLPSVKLVLSV
jgi:hypothetical protein